MSAVAGIRRRTRMSRLAVALLMPADERLPLLRSPRSGWALFRVDVRALAHRRSSAVERRVPSAGLLATSEDPIRKMIQALSSPVFGASLQPNRPQAG